jgi:2,4-dienoyl-CoA reductase-like NADH-dependent reductase (Old Yellow Enzyme family)/thioredoxin reductase
VEFKYLFSPLKIGPITIKNRIMMCGHALVHNIEGIITEDGIYYMVERAKGGVGAFMLGYCLVHPREPLSRNAPDLSALPLTMATFMPRGYDERNIPPLKKAADMMHEYGCKLFLQVGLYGAWMGKWSASTLPDPADARITAAELEQEEIDEIIEGYGKTAMNAKKAGLDGIEIHDHGGMVHQFMSPLWNRRTDKYGGSLDNRLRFLFQILDRVKEVMGDDMAISVRLCCDEFLPGGIGVLDAKEIAQKLEASGKVDLINVDIGVEPTQFHIMIAPMYTEVGYQLYAAEAVKEVVKKVPIGCVGRINDPVFAEKILADGKADMIGMVRALIADPELPNKAREGRLDDIRPCVYDNEGCLGYASCTVNPTAFKEKAYGIGTLKRAEKSKNVMVIGGGPAGMECARVAALRGHNVTLYEKENDVGGLINLACKMPGRMELEGIKRWLKLQIEKAGVKVILNKEVTPEFVLEMKPDVVVVATGSEPWRDGFNTAFFSPIEGWDQKNVVTIDDILRGKVEVGNNVVVWDSVGYINGLEIAELLAEQGKKVEILTLYPCVGGTTLFMNIGVMPYLYERALKKGVKFTPNTIIKWIEGNTIVAMNPWTQEEIRVEGVDTIVFAVSRKPNDALYKQLKGKVKEIYRVGDCYAPHNIMDAIHGGHRVGRMI